MSIVFSLLVAVALVFGPPTLASADTVKRMNKEELKSIMDSGEVSIIDVRTGRDWSASEFKIKGAERVTVEEIIADPQKYPKDRTIVLYCA
jgi:rhodanese-related sulfurtransferase